VDSAGKNPQAEPDHENAGRDDEPDGEQYRPDHMLIKRFAGRLSGRRGSSHSDLLFLRKYSIAPMHNVKAFPWNIH